MKILLKIHRNQKPDTCACCKEIFEDQLDIAYILEFKVCFYCEDAQNCDAKQHDGCC